MKPKIIEYWETDRLPQMHKTSPQFRRSLNTAYNSGILQTLYDAPFLPPSEIKRLQFKRIKGLINLAYYKIPLYQEKYRSVGFEPGDLKSWEDYRHLPVVTKDELIEAFPSRCVNPDLEYNDLFPTRSSGSSGKTLRIYVDPNAIIVDTLQGVRQFWLQNRGIYSKDHIVAHIYTVPWWVDSLGDEEYQTIFISSLIPPEVIGRILEEVNPDIMSIYPTNLHSILPYISDRVKDKLFLAVVHSEISSKEERNIYARELRKPVLDEYSSEELTRIALELPCGHYHICEDAVVLDIVDPDTYQPLEDGTGLVIGTNLLNTGMPFIRYIQGDFITVSEQKPCNVRWRQIEKIEGRLNDAFIKSDGGYIPAGTILDITYRWMFDTGINIREFEIIQKGPQKIIANLSEPNVVNEDIFKSRNHLKKLLEYVLGNIDLEFNLASHIEKKSRKYRPIRREF